MYYLTVVICVFNEGFSILNAIRSLNNNKISNNLEIIVVDDCSSNPITLRLLYLLKRFTLIKVIYSTTNKGLSNSRNLGFLNATTNYILPLDADDILPPKTLDNVYKAFLENPEIDFLFGNYTIIDKQNDKTTTIDCSNITENNFLDKNELASNWTLLGTSPCKKSTWLKVGGYSLNYSNTVQDVDFWIRVLKSECSGLYLNYSIYIWNRSMNGMNSTYTPIDNFKLLDEHRDFYLTSNNKPFFNDIIFDGYYSSRQKKSITPFGKRYFFQLSRKNKLRFILFLFRTSLR